MDMPATMGELNSQMISTGNTDVGTNFKMLDTKAAAFETQNGESILLFYNPNCVANMGESHNYFSQPKICANMIYDLNGAKGPNTVGKDIGFLTILYPADSVVVAPMPYRQTFTDVSSTEAASACKKAGDEYRIPTKDELASLFVNKNLLGSQAATSASSHWFSSSKIVYSNGDIVNWLMVARYGEYRIPFVNAEWNILCVQRN